MNVQWIVHANQDLNLAVMVIEKAIAGFSPEIGKTKQTYRPRVVLESAEYGYVKVQVCAYVPEV